MGENGFEFQFERVLEVRRRQQQALEAELHQFNAAVAESEAVIERWKRIRTETLDGLALARREGEREECRRHARYLDHVRRRLGSAREELEQLRRQRGKVRAELEGVLRAVKMLENYRERLEREFLRNQEKAEQQVVELHSTHSFIQARRAQ